MPALALALLLAAPLLAAAKDDPDTVFRAVIAAAQRGDRATMARLTDPGFVQHHGYGLAEPRTLWLGEPAMARGDAQFTEYAPSVRIVGATAIRDSVVRIRRTARGIDSWTRSLAVLVHARQSWRLAELQSALLYEGPIAGAAPPDDVLGRYAGDGGNAFALARRDELVEMRFDDGRVLPLIPLADDRFVAGIGSTLRFERDGAGRVTAASRWYGDRLAARAARANP